MIILKYILALFVPWVSFFVQKKPTHGVVCIIFTITAWLLLRKAEGVFPVLIIQILSFTKELLPRVWAIYVVYKTPKENSANGRIEELS
jgi:hypothetical protein